MKTFIFLTIVLMTTVLKAELPKTWFPEERSYRHHLFIDQKACDEYQAGGRWFNCFQWLDLNPDGTAMVVLTDIANPASYEIIENTVVVRTENGDAPPEMVFILDNTGRNLVLKDSNSIWELDQNPK